MLSKSCSYGVRAVIYLASLKRQDYVSIQHISDKLEISFHFLTKILQKLTRRNILESSRGPKGGVLLAMHPSKVTILEIIEIIDGKEAFSDCTLGLAACSDKTPCPLHEKSILIKKDLRNLFGKTTVEELANKLNDVSLKLII
ncbi:Rrf2 family transcriptional regulator [Deltaproteobacteria bacterium TL4]